MKQLSEVLINLSEFSIFNKHGYQNKNITQSTASENETEIGTKGAMRKHKVSLCILFQKHETDTSSVLCGNYNLKCQPGAMRNHVGRSSAVEHSVIESYTNSWPISSLILSTVARRNLQVMLCLLQIVVEST
jgi:hypothetical protein